MNKPVLKRAKLDIIQRFEKAEVVIIGILLFTLLFLPLALVLSGVAAFAVYKIWKERKNTRRVRPFRKKRR